MRQAGIVVILLAYSVTSFGSWVSTKDWDSKMWTNQLLWYVGKGDAAGCSQALKNGAQVNQKDYRGRTPLMWAIHNRQFKVAKLLLEYKSNVGIQDDRGRTALHRASSAGRSDFVDLFMRHGADPNVLDKKGESPLDKVVFCSKNRSIITCLWTSGNAKKLSKCWRRIAKKTDVKMIGCLLSKGLFLSGSDLDFLLPVHKQVVADHSRAITEVLDVNGEGCLPTVLVGLVRTFLVAPEQLSIMADMEQQYPKLS